MTNRILLLSLLLLNLTMVPLAADELSDRAFLLEEAFPAEENVTRHSVMFADDAWNYVYTREWVASDDAHHLSCSLPLVRALDDRSPALGDVTLDYRRQWNRGRVSFAPRFSLGLPTARTEDREGAAPGIELNLPLSIAHSPRLATHWSVGASAATGAERFGGERSYTARGGIVWAARPGVALVFEAMHAVDESTGVARALIVTVVTPKS